MSDDNTSGECIKWVAQRADGGIWYEGWIGRRAFGSIHPTYLYKGWIVACGGPASVSFLSDTLDSLEEAQALAESLVPDLERIAVVGTKS